MTFHVIIVPGYFFKSLLMLFGFLTIIPFLKNVDSNSTALQETDLLTR